jgi:transcriptional regulator with XRE-family HTH domain
MKPMYLRTIREQRGLTQEQLEALAKVAQNTISRLESDPKARPVFHTVVALAEALHIDPKQLRFGPDPRRRPKTRVA